MRTTLSTILLTAGLAGIGLVGASAGLAAPRANAVHEPAGLETLVQPAQYWRGDRCERLRRACIYKEERGEVGEGNCRRYREECGGSGGISYCERLRRACIYKEDRGEVGEGNCRRYRRECGGY